MLLMPVGFLPALGIDSLDLNVESFVSCDRKQQKGEYSHILWSVVLDVKSVVTVENVGFDYSVKQNILPTCATGQRCNMVSVHTSDKVESQSLD